MFRAEASLLRTPRFCLDKLVRSPPSRVGRQLAVSSVCDLEGRVFLVTGCTDGIGKHTATRLAENNATVIIHGRSESRGEKARQDIIKATGNESVEYFNADFTSMGQIREMSEAIKAKYSRIDCLINNAGVYETQKCLSEDGYEMSWAVNVIAPFLLTSLLLDRLRAGTKSRIINVSSISQTDGGGRIDFDNLQHEKGYSAHSAYGLSKLCAVCFTKDLAERLKPEGITVNCLDPGTVNTKMLLAGWGPCGIPVYSCSHSLSTSMSETDKLGRSHGSFQ
ncbi:hypothetical protein CYMTET_21620 [Cymbomonas tetramitiformis]|uniref:Uncharacterized protein n=1 Tax=Cymbomonas tetramitiformis TaxID=36881 RepID=A0AAE0L2S8_9CHLO|nr:hypothetical protein CYMTET_21620 [Cymbomonas tetramitiformis]